MNAKELREQYEKEIDPVTGEVSYVEWLESRLIEKKAEPSVHFLHLQIERDDLTRQLTESQVEVKRLNKSITDMMNENQKLF